MSKRWPFPGARLFHYIERGRGSSDPATLRRWYRTLDSMATNSNDKKAAQLRERVVRMAPRVLRIKPVALSRIERRTLGPVIRERLPAGPEAADVPIVVLGDLDGAGPLTVVDGRHRVWAAIARRAETIRAVSIRGNKRPNWTRRVPSESRRPRLNPDEPPYQPR